MKNLNAVKFIVIIIFLLVTTYSYSQNNFSVIIDSTAFGIREMYSVRTSNSNLKDIYLQEGMIQGPNGVVGGRYFKLNDTRTGWTVQPYLAPKNCSGNYFPVERIARSRTNPNVMLINGLYNCGNENGDFNKLTKDGGITVIDLPFGGGSNGQQCGGFEIHPQNENIMFIVHSRYNNIQYDYPLLFKSTDGGSNWSVMDTIYEAFSFSSNPWQHPGVSIDGFLKITPWNGNAIICNGSNLMVSSNGGNQFFGMGDVPAVKFLFFDEYRQSRHAVILNNQIMTNYGDIVFGGWYANSAPFNITSVEVDEHHSGGNRIYYAGSPNGLYKSTNSGVSWFLYHNFSPSSNKIIGISKDYFGGDTLIVATESKVYKIWTTMTNILHESTLPDKFELYQNYPNPFNPETNIKFSLPKSDVLTLKVYSTDGREIDVLMSGEYSPGIYSANFNASDLSSGVYFYRLETSTFTETKKMVVVK